MQLTGSKALPWKTPEESTEDGLSHLEKKNQPLYLSKDANFSLSCALEAKAGVDTGAIRDEFNVLLPFLTQ